jgi:hypothetical protein
MDDSSYQAPFIEGRRRRSPKRRMIISIIVVFLLILIGIGSIQFLGNTFTGSVTPTPTPEPTPIVFPTDVPTATPSPAVKVSVTPTVTPKPSSLDPKTKLERSALRVLVENGSGVVGAANKIAQTLKTAGYTIVGTQNADAFTYEDVTISVKPDKAAYLPLLKQDLSNEYTVGATNTTFAASTSADAVVIVGK